MTHDELAADLAAHLRAERRMVWTNIQLGPSGSPRPDVYAIFKSYASPAPTAYEVKVSVPDFRSDVTSGKWQSYLPYASAVYFAAERGLIGKADLPTHCGLILRGEKGWRAAKRPVLNPVTVPQDALLKLLIDGVEREGPRFRLMAWDPELSKIRKKLGEDVAVYCTDAIRARADIAGAESAAADIIATAQETARRIREEANSEAVQSLRGELIEILQLDERASMWELRAAVGQLKRDAAEHPALRDHRQLTTMLQRALDSYGCKEDASERAEEG